MQDRKYAGQGNAGPKMHVLKLRDHITGLENAGPEKGGPKRAGGN